jgi:2-dehydropantoate 2-reductase
MKENESRDIMKIGIIGGGSVGLLFSYYLSDLFDVTIYTRTKNQKDELLHNGLHLIESNKIHKKNIKAEVFDLWNGKEELTIIAVKQYQLSEIVMQIVKKQKENTNFLFLQNGMGHLKILKLLNSETIYVSTLEHGAYRKNLFTVEHNGIGQTKLALYRGDFNLPSSIFTIPKFPIIFETNYFEMLINKLVVNAIINPLTALLNVKNGVIVENENFLRVAHAVFVEIADVLNLENRERYFQQVIDVCQKTSENRSSMLKDLEAKNLTEIDAILGYILNEAELKKIETPICKTLYDFIKGSERLERN